MNLLLIDRNFRLPVYLGRHYLTLFTVKTKILTNFKVITFLIYLQTKNDDLYSRGSRAWKPSIMWASSSSRTIRSWTCRCCRPSRTASRSSVRWMRWTLCSRVVCWIFGSRRTIQLWFGPSLPGTFRMPGSVLPLVIIQVVST